MNQGKHKAEVRKLTLTATLAAIYTIFRAVPIFRLIGISGSIAAGGIIAPILGIFLEPSYGLIAVFIGTMIASFLPWNPLKFYGLDFLPSALNVVLVSLVVRGRRTEAISMFLVVLGLFIINPFTRAFVGIASVSPPLPYYWLHLVAVVVLLTPLSRNLAGKLTSGGYRGVLAAVVALAFMGTMIEHLTGGILFASILGPGALKLWPAIFIVYPIERAILVSGAVLVCAPLVSILKSSVRERLLEVHAFVSPTVATSSGLGKRD